MPEPVIPPGPGRNRKTVRSMVDFMREYMPKEYERRRREGRCMHCGELPTRRRPEATL